MHALHEGRMVRVFGYGSLLNPKTLRERFDGKITADATLRGYQRTFRKEGREHLYLTLREIEPDGNGVWGTLFDVTLPGFAKLARTEPGYDLLDVTDGLAGYPADAPQAWCFIAPPLGDEKIPPAKMRIRRSYLNRCLGGVPEPERELWLAETEIPSGVTIDEDESPVLPAR